MSTASDSSPLTHSLALTTQPGQPVTVVASPGISNSQFRGAIESLLFKQWLKNLQSETGVLANGAASLKQVLIQVEEETDIRLKLDDMFDLTAFQEPSTGGRVFPSPGGCDEDISIFLYRSSVDKQIIEQLQNWTS